MIDDKETADVRARLWLPAILHFPEEDEQVHTITLMDSASLRLSLIVSDVDGETRKSLLNDLRENEGKYEAYIRSRERTLIVPSVEIVLKDQIFDRTELVARDDRTLLQGDQLINSSWCKVSQEIVVVYNALIDELFKMYPRQRWVRKEAPRFSATILSMDIADFPWCLNSWKIEYRKTSSDEWIGGFSFEIEGGAIAEVDLQIAEASISRDNLANIGRSLAALRDSKARLPVPWEYLYYASRHLDEGNFRNAIIDLDTAIDFIVRKHVGTKMNIHKSHITKILKESSTSDLLLVAKAMATDDSEFSTWNTLNELHSLRGTVVHRYQRRFSEVHLEMIEKARVAIISVLGNLALS